MDTVKKIILEETAYVSGSAGNIPDNELSISASQLGKEDLQIYLQMIYGPQPEEHITDATLGTIFHKGMETIIREKSKKETEAGVEYYAEQSFSTKIIDGWWLTGTADLVIATSEGFEIHDYKLTKKYTVKSYLSNPTDHQYTLQLSALEYLLREENMEVYIPGIESVIDFFLKDSIKTKFEAVHEPIVVKTKRSDEIIELFKKKANAIQHHLDNATIPSECKDRWPRKVSGKTVDTLCEYYCSQKKNCPYYKKKQEYRNTNVELVAGWGA